MPGETYARHSHPASRARRRTPGAGCAGAAGYRGRSDCWRAKNALQKNDQPAAQQVAQEMAKKAELMGKRAEKKTMLVKQALQELNAAGRVSRKTQLAVDDIARTVELPE